MLKRKITINKKAKLGKRYPLVSVRGTIFAPAMWQSIPAALKAKLPTCVTKGHLLSQKRNYKNIW